MDDELTLRKEDIIFETIPKIHMQAEVAKRLL